MKKTALIIVDVQNDFLPGGALPVKDGNQIIPVINKLLSRPFDVIVASKDWHPADHGSFAANHPGKSVGDIITLYDLEQILWPIHCVQETFGSEFAPGWDVSKVHKIIFKGTDAKIDSYSTFFDNGLRKSTGLGEYLKEKEVSDVYVVGLATDYCVKYSVYDALHMGFNTHVIVEGCRAVNLFEGDEARALEAMEISGAHLI